MKVRVAVEQIPEHHLASLVVGVVNNEAHELAISGHAVKECNHMLHFVILCGHRSDSHIRQLVPALLAVAGHLWLAGGKGHQLLAYHILARKQVNVGQINQSLAGHNITGLNEARAESVGKGSSGFRSRNNAQTPPPAPRAASQARRSRSLSMAARLIVLNVARNRWQ